MTPTVQKGVELEGADGIAKLIKRNIKLEKILWEKQVAYEVRLPESS